MNVRTAVVSLILLAACEKTSDLGPLQDEANGIASTYKARFDGLGTRLKALDDRSRRLPPPVVAGASDLPQLKQLAAETNSRLTEMRNLSQNATTMINTAAKSATPREELVRVIGDLTTKFETGHTQVNTNLDTVESWISYLELRPAAPPPPPAAGSGAPGSPAPGSPPPPAQPVPEAVH